MNCVTPRAETSPAGIFELRNDVILAGRDAAVVGTLEVSPDRRVT
jgi:hypothetical protein